MDGKILGKISSVTFGKRDGRFGLWLTLSGEYSVQTSYECWDPEGTKPIGEGFKWTEEDRDKQLINIMRKISKLLKQAKVDDVNNLLNVPVEIEFEGNMLKDWRILEEVL